MNKIILAIAFFVSIQAIAFKQEPTKQKTETLAKNGTDPVCKMPVKKGTQIISKHKDLQYGFCSKSCKEKFDKQPDKYVK